MKDKRYYEGYKKALEDMTNELQTLEKDTDAPVSVEVYEILTWLKNKAKEN